MIIILIDKIYKYLFELPFYESHWQDISLDDIAMERNINPEEVAAENFYEEFYRRLKQNSHAFENEWINEKKTKTLAMRRYIDQAMLENKSQKILSIGAGTGFIEEELLQKGLNIFLHECQPSSFDYLRQKNIKFQEFVTTNLSDIPENNFNLIFAFTVSYCFTYEQYFSFFKSVYNLLSDKGQLILFDSYLISALKKLNYSLKLFSRFQKQPKGVHWGWLRHPYLHRYLANKAGLNVVSQYFTDNYCSKVSNPNQRHLVWFVFEKK